MKYKNKFNLKEIEILQLFLSAMNIEIFINIQLRKT